MKLPRQNKIASREQWDKWLSRINKIWWSSDGLECFAKWWSYSVGNLVFINRIGYQWQCFCRSIVVKFWLHSLVSEYHCWRNVTSCCAKTSNNGHQLAPLTWWYFTDKFLCTGYKTFVNLLGTVVHVVNRSGGNFNLHNTF